MERWKIGKLEEWNDGRMEEWMFNWQLTTYYLRLMPYDCHLHTGNC